MGITLANPPALGTRSDGSLLNVGTEMATVYALALESTAHGSMAGAATAEAQ